MFMLKANKTTEVFKAFDGIGSVADIVDQQLPTYGTRSAIRFDTSSGYHSLNFLDYHGYIRRMISWFMQQGIEGQVIATFCKNRLEWDMIAMACFYRANALFPLDTKTNDPELKHLLAMNPPDYMLVSRAQLSRVRGLLAELALDTRLIIADLFDLFEDDGHEHHKAVEGELSLSATLPQQAIDTLSPSTRLREDGCILGHYPTSGTTSLPKIVQISHRNIIAEVNEAIDVINLRLNEELLNIGPYTHIATLVEFLVTKSRGFSVTYFTREPDDDDVLEDEIKKLKSQGVRIKVLMAVPKFWIYLLKEVLEEMKNKPVLRKLYDHLVSIERNEKLYDIGTLDKAKLTAMRILLRNKLGGYFSYGISSSMKLDGSIVEIFGKLGVTVIDIYGATECCGIISRNRLNELKPGSCGRIISLLDYRLTDKERIPGIEKEVGMLEVKGSTVMHSYIDMAQETGFTEDGYYVTGDLAWIDDDGFLHLVGRKKELTKWEDGSYIDPQYLSNLMVRNIFIKDALVTRTRPEDDFLSVYIYPDYKRIRKDPSWCKDIATGISEDAALRQRFEAAIDYAQSLADMAPRLSKEPLFILPRSLERTPTHKIKFIVELARLDQARAI